MRSIIPFIVVFTALCTSVDAGVIAYTNKSAWQNAAGAHTTIDFVGGQDGFPILPMHSTDLGVSFTGQQLGYWHSSNFSDGEGIAALNETLWATFDTPQRAIAVDYPGQIRFQLYSKGELIYTSNGFFAPGGQVMAFAGLISDQPFDTVYLYRMNATHVFVDNLFFAVPAPGALALLGLAALGWYPRRRS